MSQTHANRAFVHNFVDSTDFYGDTTTIFDVQVNDTSVLKVTKGGGVTQPHSVVAATADGLTTGIIPSTATFAQISTNSTADTVALPYSTMGQTIRGRVGPDTSGYTSLVGSEVGYFPLDDTTGTVASNDGSGADGAYDITGTNASETAVPALAFWSTGTGQGLNGSSDHITTTLSPTGSTGSMACWMKRNSGAVTDSAMGCFEASGTKRCFLGINASGNIGAGIGSDSWDADLDSGVEMDPQREYHAAVTWNTGGDVKIYVNGVLKVTHAFAGSLPTSTNYFLGARSDDGTDASWFDGCIDEVVVSTSELSQANITTLFQGGSAQACEICSVIGSGELINGASADSVGTGVSVPAWSGWEATCFSPGEWILTVYDTTGRINNYVYSPDYDTIQENTSAEYTPINPKLTTTMYVIVG